MTDFKGGCSDFKPNEYGAFHMAGDPPGLWSVSFCWFLLISSSFIIR